MSQTKRWARLLEASAGQYKDPFAEQFERLERTEWELTQATADFLDASRQLRATIDEVTK